MGQEAGSFDASQEPDIWLKPELAPQIMVEGSTGEAHGFGTVYSGQAMSFAAETAEPCPLYLTCSYAWDFGNGETSAQATPPAVTYAAEGLYRVALALADQNGNDLGTATAVASVWSGFLVDDFERAQVAWEERFWLRPLSGNFDWSIDDGWLYVKHDLGQPGSTAIMAAPLVRTVHTEITVRRSQDLLEEHYADVILRMHPEKLAGSFYRVRIKEATAANNNEIDLSIFKIHDAADEHGDLLNPEPPIVGGIGRSTDVRIIIDLYDDDQGIPTFDVRFVDAANPTLVLLEDLGVKDDHVSGVPPHTYAGLVGLTHLMGETWFDDFVLQDLQAP